MSSDLRDNLNTHYEQTSQSTILPGDPFVAERFLDVEQQGVDSPVTAPPQPPLLPFPPELSLAGYRVSERPAALAGVHRSSSNCSDASLSKSWLSVWVSERQ